jgi:hypothetical protein
LKVTQKYKYIGEVEAFQTKATKQALMKKENKI